MTFATPDPTPGIPGSSAWTAQQSPVFQQPGPPPEPIGGQFELAGWWSRVGAQLIDALLRLLVATAIAAVGFVLIADQPFSFSESFDTATSTTGGEFDGDLAAINLIWFLLTAAALYLLSALIYAPAFMARWRGATPGKRMLGIRVIREDGRELGFGGAFLREPVLKGIVVGVIGGSVAILPLISYLWPLWDRECRAGHDFMARTRVIKTAPRATGDALA